MNSVESHASGSWATERSSMRHRGVTSLTVQDLRVVRAARVPLAARSGPVATQSAACDQKLIFLQAGGMGLAGWRSGGFYLLVERILPVVLLYSFYVFS